MARKCLNINSYDHETRGQKHLKKHNTNFQEEKKDLLNYNLIFLGALEMLVLYSIIISL